MNTSRAEMQIERGRLIVRLQVIAKGKGPHSLLLYELGIEGRKGRRRLLQDECKQRTDNASCEDRTATARVEVGREFHNIRANHVV